MTQSIHPFLMFQDGQGARAMDFYLGLFRDARIVADQRYGPEGPGPEGTIMHAIIALGGLEVMISDSFVKHAFGMTPATSLFVTCDNEGEFARLFAALSDGGKVLMLPDNYGFSRKFGWTDDRFGASWQLNLP